MDVTGGVLGGCCQVTVIALLSSCAIATTLEGHEGTPGPTSDHERNGKSFITLYMCGLYVSRYSTYRVKC